MIVINLYLSGNYLSQAFYTGVSELQVIASVTLKSTILNREFEPTAHSERASRCLGRQNRAVAEWKELSDLRERSRPSRARGRCVRIYGPRKLPP